MTTRKPGEGTYWKEDGVWCWRRRFGKAGKGQRSTVVKHENYKEFQRLVREAQAEIGDRGAPARGEMDGLTVEQLLSRWLELHVKPGLDYKTWESYEERCRVAIVPTIGSIKVRALSAGDVQQALINSMRARKKADGSALYKPRTISYTVSVLGRAFAKMKQKVRWLSILEGLTLPEPDPERDRVLKSPEIEDLAAHLTKFRIARTSRRDEPLVVFLLNVMCRKSEAFAVQVTDLDLVAGSVRIAKQIQWYRNEKDERAWRFKAPKGKKNMSIRTVALNTDALAACKRQKSQIATDKLRAGPGYIDSGLLFATESGRPHSARNLKRTLDGTRDKINADRKVAKLPSMDAFTVHDLRRTGLTHLARTEPRLHVVGAVAGHAKGSRTTARLYVWADQALQDEALRSLSLRGASAPAEAAEEFVHPQLDLG